MITVIQVKVRPRARSSYLEQQEDGSWLASLKSPPVEGKANAELVSLVAAHFKCAKSAVSIKVGNAARSKLVKIQGS